MLLLIQCCVQYKECTRYECDAFCYCCCLLYRRQPRAGQRTDAIPIPASVTLLALSPTQIWGD